MDLVYPFIPIEKSGLLSVVHKTTSRCRGFIYQGKSHCTDIDTGIFNRFGSQVSIEPLQFALMQNQDQPWATKRVGRVKSIPSPRYE